MNRRNLVFALIGCCFILFLFLLLFLYKLDYYRFSIGSSLPTYFEYTEAELTNLKKIKIPNTKISKKDLRQWDEILFDLVRKNELTDIEAANAYAYFFTAERDALFLAYNISHGFYGSLDPISKGVLCIFFPTYCSEIEEKHTDPFSKKISEIVLEKVKERLLNEMAQSKTYPEPKELEFVGPKPYIGQAAGSQIPWYIESGSSFRVAPPPSKNDPKWDEQLKLVIQARSNMTEEQKKAVIYWAGGPGTLTAPGIWLDIANDYMAQVNTPLEKVLLVQSTLAMAMVDAAIAVYDSKYTYWVIRPNIRDPSLKTFMPTPFHPSYPAGHATFSIAAATILTHFFPAEKENWFKLANEASQSRVWGGIHYPIDSETGKILGANIGNKVIKSIESAKK